MKLIFKVFCFCPKFLPGKFRYLLCINRDICAKIFNKVFPQMPLTYTPRKRFSPQEYAQAILAGDRIMLSRAITLIESKLPSDVALAEKVLEIILPHTGNSLRVGITGVPGVGKSTFIESFGKLITGMGKKLAVLTIDPSSQRSKGSILGDKTRMESLANDPMAYIRPSASGATLGGGEQQDARDDAAVRSGRLRSDPDRNGRGGAERNDGGRDRRLFPAADAGRSGRRTPGHQEGHHGDGRCAGDHQGRRRQRYHEPNGRPGVRQCDAPVPAAGFRLGTRGAHLLLRGAARPGRDMGGHRPPSRTDAQDRLFPGQTHGTEHRMDERDHRLLPEIRFPACTCRERGCWTLPSIRSKAGSCPPSLRPNAFWSVFGAKGRKEPTGNKGKDPFCKKSAAALVPQRFFYRRDGGREVSPCGI